MVLIRDLSVYDPPPVAYSDYDGLILRCFNGSVKDRAFELHKAGAIAARKPWWPYAFYNFLYPAEPQVDAVINILRDDPGALPVAWDVEEWAGHQYPARDILLNSLRCLHDGIANAFSKHCQFYMNPATIHYLRPIPSWLLECPLWIANWGVTIPDYEPWPRWCFHQYRGEPDLNRFNGSDAEYWAYVGASTSIPELVRITASVLNVRSQPMGAILGQVKKGWLLGVNGEAMYNGIRWFRIGNAYVSSEWCEVVD